MTVEPEPADPAEVTLPVLEDVPGAEATAELEVEEAVIVTPSVKSEVVIVVDCLTVD